MSSVSRLKRELEELKLEITRLTLPDLTRLAAYELDAALLNRIPSDLQAAFAEAMADPTRRRRLDGWLLEPFEKWARMPDGFYLPAGVDRLASRSSA